MLKEAVQSGRSDTPVRTDDAVEAPDSISTQTEESAAMASPMWSNAWQIPTILFALALIVGGLYHASRQAPEHDFDGAFNQVEQLIDSQRFEAAAVLLEHRIEPNLDMATEIQKGRFQALAADVLYLKMAYDATENADLTQEVARRYQQAQQLRFDLDPRRIERWTMTMLTLGEIETARSRMALLDGWLYDSRHGEEARRARHRLMRRVVEHSLRQPQLPYDAAMAVLAEFRSTPELPVDDEIWAVARQTELRLENGNARDAVDRLQIEMRRIESHDREATSRFGEFYILLARGYHAIGESEFALDQVQRALAMLDTLDSMIADALVVLGRIHLSESRFEDAHDAFTHAIIDFDGTRGFLPAVLGRAEVLGVLGRHIESMDDFHLLAERLPHSGIRRDVTPSRVVEAIVDRHDAVLALGQLDTALMYIELAERFFSGAAVPEPALFRLATTNRVIADRLLGGDVAGDRGTYVYETIDVGLRAEASRHFKRAGDYFVLHAGSVQHEPAADRSWIESQFNAADCYDRAGYYDLAIRHFRVYIEGRSESDPNRIAAKYRLARCLQATREFEQAAELYETIIRNNPTSTWAERSHVPLAICYKTLGSIGRAEQQLLRVVKGGEPLRPDAVDFREALFTLGTLYYNLGDHTRAIEELDKALRYYPDDPLAGELRFRLADSYRASAIEMRSILGDSTLPRSIVKETEALRLRHLTEAIMLFTRVVDEYERTGERALDALQADYLRYAHLYRADCTFELGEYAAAIELYDAAARKYAEHPSSLSALIQIVNAYVAQGDRARALTAHNRVLLRLQQLPEGALESREAIMNEEAWRRWLQGLPPGVGVQ